jgi:hypothetical protein
MVLGGAKCLDLAHFDVSKDFQGVEYVVLLQEKPPYGRFLSQIFCFIT